MPRCSSCNQSRWVYARFGRFADELEWLTGFLPYGCLACGRRGWHRSRRTPPVVDELRRAYPRLLRIPTAWLTPAMATVVRRPGGGWVVAFALGFGSGALMFSVPTPVEPAPAQPRLVELQPVEPRPVTAARIETPRATPATQSTTPASPPRVATARVEPKPVKRPDVKVAAARDQRGRQKAAASAAPARRPPSKAAEAPAPVAQASAPAAPAPAPAAPTAAAASQDLPRFHGILEIHSEPLGALVSVDGRVVGATPLLLKAVPAGSRVLRIESDGYERWSFAARVVANQATRIVATLQRGSDH